MAKPGEKVYWSLGPIAKRAIGLMAIDAVIGIIEKAADEEVIKDAIPNDIPPEVIDIFRGILR